MPSLKNCHMDLAQSKEQEFPNNGPHLHLQVSSDSDCNHPLLSSCLWLVMNILIGFLDSNVYHHVGFMVSQLTCIWYATHA